MPLPEIIFWLAVFFLALVGLITTIQVFRGYHMTKED